MQVLTRALKMSTLAHPCPEVCRHREMLAVAALVVVLALVFQVRPDERVIVTGLPDYPLPPACMSREYFGVKCPGCGLTRSFVHLAHADWAASWKCHRLGWLLATAVLLQFPYRLLALRRGGQSPLGDRVPRWFGCLLIISLLVNWTLEILSPPSACQHREYAQKTTNECTTNDEDGRYHPADPPCIGNAFALGIHAPGAHFFEIIVPHDPGHRPENESKAEKTEDAQGQDQ